MTKSVRVPGEYVVGRQKDGRPIIRKIKRIWNGLALDERGNYHTLHDLKCCPPSYRLTRRSVVVIKKPDNHMNAGVVPWYPEMDKYDGMVVKLKHAIINSQIIIYDNWQFHRDWLVPV